VTTTRAPSSAAAAYTGDELIATVIARQVRDGETVAVGTLGPVPASGVLLAHFTHAPRARVMIMNHPDHWPFRGGSKEFYDFAQRGGLDLFFLSGGQIDEHGNLNLIAIGDVAHPRVRLPGGAGSAMLYYLAGRVIVFRTDHSPRIFVERVDHVAAPGSTPPDVVRPGGPWKAITPLCVFRFDRDAGRLTTEALHPGVTRDALQQHTGFRVQYAPDATTTPPPTAQELEVLRTRVRAAVARVYPRYAASCTT
jgi:glutaconate CoA-transferase subunit B